MRWVSLTLLFLVACGGNGPSLEVLEQGKSPRHLLRYKVQEGTTHELVMSMSMSMGAGSTVTVDLTIELTIVKVTAQGDITYEFRFTDVGSEAGPLPGMDDLIGMSGMFVVDSRGVHKSGAVRLADGASPQFKQMMTKFEESMQQLSCPFPQEEVGVGAKWKLGHKIKTPAFSLDQTTTFELVEFDGRRGRLKVSITQEADDEEMKLPNGMTVKLVELRSKGSGELEFDLSKPFPVNSHVNMTTNLKVSMKGRTASQTIGIRIEVGEE